MTEEEICPQDDFKMAEKQRSILETSGRDNKIGAADLPDESTVKSRGRTQNQKKNEEGENRS